VLLTGLILAGYVGTWFAALQRAPASVVTSVLVPGAVVTGILTAVSKGAPASPTVVVGYLLVVAAATLIAISALRAAELAATPRPRQEPATVVAD
jgi:drug/metabolite transporter (DMT)-like permease